jgi:integrase
MEVRMPRLSLDRLPKYRLHKGTGQAVVTLDGKEFYLGIHNTAASRREYERLVTTWQQNGRCLPTTDEATILELCAAFWRHAKEHYVKHGRPTDEQATFKICLKYLKATHRDQVCREFGPLNLKAIRQQMIDSGNSRKYINKQVSRIKLIFKWGVANELVPIETYQRLATLQGLQQGKSKAKETKPVLPVGDEIVEATLPHVPRVIAAMIRLQRLTGMRPEEVCLIRPVDVDRRTDVWEYRPESHKCEHHDRWRVVMFGPQAQEVLLPFMLREDSAYCFRPKRWGAVKRARFDTDSYRGAIHRACDRAFPAPPPLGKSDEETIAQWQARLSDKQRCELKAWQADHRWNPNQLRHSAATAIRKHADLESARTVLGHSSTTTTEIYAERDLSVARRIAREVG